MTGGEWYMDRATDIREYENCKCPWCGNIIEVCVNDVIDEDKENILCPECGMIMSYGETEVYDD